MRNNLYLPERRCLNLFVLQGQILCLLLSPRKTSFSAFCLQDALGLVVSQAMQSRKTPEINEGRGKCVGCWFTYFFFPSLQLTLVSK